MTEQRAVEADMSAMGWYFQKLSECKFCKDECPVLKNKRNWGCGCRPVRYMKESSTLKRFNKKEG